MPLPDGKRLPLSRLSQAIPQFLLHVFILLPLWLTVILPIALVSLVVTRTTRALCGGGKKKKAKSSKDAADDTPVEVAKDRTPLGERTYSLVLFGATGFTGQLAAKYLFATYGDGKDHGFTWALAGRSRKKLEAVRAGLGANAEGIPIVHADSFDQASLRALAADARVIISTVGPFARYGTGLVRACAEHGTSYGDITGESDWVRRCIDRFAAPARRSGARIVHFCGHDCVPWDLACLLLAKALRGEGNDGDGEGEALREVRVLDVIRASASGGTLETIFHSLEHREKVKAACRFDPPVGFLQSPCSD